MNRLKSGLEKMIRILLPYVWTLSNELEPLGSLPEEPVAYKDVFLTLVVAESSVQNLSSSSLFAPYLRASYQLSQQLLGAIRAQTTHKDFDRQLAAYELWNIKNLYGQYRTALLAELGSLNAYFVTQKGGFDSLSLLLMGETLFPAELAAKVPEAIFDCREAGKCLAFELPNACGFHTFRATESVLRRYYSDVTGGHPHPKVRSLGVYVRALQRASKGDEKILAALLQMTTLHRNPLIHPEAVLTVDEALSIVGLARSAISGMLVALPVLPPTTTTQPQPPPPATL